MPSPNDSRRFKNLWPWSKPKTPGFGISNSFYLSVLATITRLPSIDEIVNPKGEGGAVVGFGAPLIGPTDKSVLAQPMARGIYAIASTDRRTVLKTMVLPKEEAGFDPGVHVLSRMGSTLGQEVIHRIQATWTLVQLNFESHDPSVYPALDFLLDIAQRLGAKTEGVIADPLSQRYSLPEELRAPNPPNAAIDARNFVRAATMPRENGIHAFTLGLSKFALPELEIYGLLPGQETPAQRLLIAISQTILQGQTLDLGDRVGAKSAPFQVAPGGLDRAQWEGIPCFELIPARTASTAESLEAWIRQTGA